ncbi:hypothetical protein J5069_06045 [Candidatus Symbiopectobacterium sp. NZEC127]|uniref:hypothetical protein n=1 Tax=Candidatus Symbiopectobacterium sp. NZEC127 TaxID=2820472 RepID=UPI0022261677|nr:hypothetical protein [Candidatus Symbiopectobacterium sp. NZEC127]MCW2485457.1 hypothetical protein [Candidatus Symbiopectobacterium sp. NZEC127]
MRIEFNIYMKVIGAEIGAILGIFQQISSLDNIYRGQRVDWFLTAKSKKKSWRSLSSEMKN